ncbi:hypothetical protein HDU98_005102 [Podochytrium sp. JEL0797]|nr:hypothetical protein HDU98_005102 [Podochytrium sp. JEL0797]
MLHPRQQPRSRRPSSYTISSSTRALSTANLSVQNSSVNPKDLLIVKDICHQLHTLNAALWHENANKSLKDLKELESLKETMLKEDELKILEMETIVAIVNTAARKEVLKANLMIHMNDEKEASTSLQQHKDEFTQFIWKRRAHSKKEMRALFSNGTGMIGRLGELISTGTLEGIHLFEQANTVRLTRDAVRWILCETEDLPAYLGKKIALLTPKVPTPILLSPTRLDFHLHPTAAPHTFHCVYASSGPSAKHLHGKKMVTEMAVQTLQSLTVASTDMEGTNAVANTSTSCAYTLAKLLDAVHPTHALLGNVLTFPLYAATMVKRRLVALGYSIAPFTEDTGGMLDVAFARSVVGQVVKGLMVEQRVLWEVSGPDLTRWRVGLVSAVHSRQNNHAVYPGFDEYSFGFDSDGTVWFNGESRPYADLPEPNPLFTTIRTIGIVVDFYAGTVGLVVDNHVLPVAIGNGAQAFSFADQEKQRAIIMNDILIPMFAIQGFFSSLFAAQARPGAPRRPHGILDKPGSTPGVTRSTTRSI